MFLRFMFFTISCSYNNFTPWPLTRKGQRYLTLYIYSLFTHIPSVAAAAADTLNNHAMFIKPRIIIKAKCLLTTNSNLSDKFNVTIKMLNCAAADTINWRDVIIFQLKISS